MMLTMDPGDWRLRISCTAGLHDEERCPQIDGSVRVEEFDARVEQRAARGDTC
jgi:hypothetical protein